MKSLGIFKAKLSIGDVGQLSVGRRLSRTEAKCPQEPKPQAIDFANSFLFNKIKLPHLSSHKKLAFSLIEIMVGLIVVSVMVAAFAPVITKKVSNTTVALSQQDNVAGKVIKSKLYNFSTALNGVDGCSLVDYNTVLKCPFEVPEGVTSVNFILVSGGGGGAGGGANTTTTAPVNLSNGESKRIYVNKFMRNVKISFMASGGGGGGGGYYYYNYTPSATIHPKSQAECDKIGTNLYYSNTGSSCITKYNLSETSILNSTITQLQSQKNYTTDQGTKICWSKTGNYYVGFSVKNIDDQDLSYKEHWTTAVKEQDYPVCTKSAAEEICSKYGYGTQYNGKWRLINATEASWLAANHPIPIGAFRKAGGDAGNNVWKAYYCETGPTNSIAVNQARANDNGSCGSPDMKTPNNIAYWYNPCLPEYAWTDNGNYALIKPQASRYIMIGNRSVTCDGSNSKYISNYFSVHATFDDCNYYTGGVTKYSESESKFINTYKGCLSLLNKERAPMSVRCAISDIGTTAATYTYDHSSGGGGGSGQYLSSVTIPQSTINSVVDGGYIDVKAGAGGSGGNGSGNGGIAYAGSDGGDSYVRVYNRYGTLIWQAYIKGGKGGGRGIHGSAGAGALASTTFTVSTSTSHTNGNAGTSGTHQTSSGSAPGGYGGPAVNGYASGGSGGAASDQSASKGGDGSGGYVSMSYETTYLGAPGGGGAGGKIVRYEGIKVTEGSRIWVKVGGGGYAGSNTNGGNGGQSAFDSYYVNGGGGGLRGVNQTGSTNPSPGGAGSVIGGATTSGAIFFKDGSNGGAASIDYSNLRGTGGVGGNGGLNNYYLSIGKGYTDLSVGCGGYYYNATYLCNNQANKNASYTGDEFANPGKVHREGSTKYGSAGSGGGGGGIDPSSTTPGAASRGQDGYVYIWWEDFAD